MWSSKPERRDWGDVTGLVCKWMHAHINTTNTTKFSLYLLIWSFKLASTALAHILTPTLLLGGPCVSSQTVKCSVSMARQGVPSALGFVMACTGISAMLDLCAEPAGIPSRSTNTFPGISRLWEETVQVTERLQVYIWTISYHKLVIWSSFRPCKQLLSKQFSRNCPSKVKILFWFYIMFKMIHLVFLHNFQESSAVLRLLYKEDKCIMHTYLPCLKVWGKGTVLKSRGSFSQCSIVQFECFPNQVSYFTLAVYIIYQTGTFCSGHPALQRSRTNLLKMLCNV